jgi:hypothetical protein
VIGLGPRGRAIRRRGLSDVPWTHNLLPAEHLRKGAARVTAQARWPSALPERKALGPLHSEADSRAAEEDKPFGGLTVASPNPLRP